MEVDKLGNIEMIEAQIMYDRIKEIDDPKEALEKLATCSLSMGMGGDLPTVRFGSYGLWLKEKGKEGWYDYLLQIRNFFGALQYGALNMPGEEPEGWITPLDYFKTKGE